MTDRQFPDPHERRRSALPFLWLFATVNYVFCDVLTLMDPEFARALVNGGPEGLPMTQGFLLASSLLMEIPFAMILVSRFLHGPWQRCSSVLAGGIMTTVQVATFFFGPPPTLHYWFFSAVEIGTTVAIVLVAWKLPSTAESGAAR